VIPFVALPVFAVLVAPPVGPDEGCPSARQVTDAMQARFPALVATAEQAQATGRPDLLRSQLDVAGDGTVVRFWLIDVHGDTQLRRALPAPGRNRPVPDCLALADTLAVIVERYLGTITHEGPEPEPPGAAILPLAATTGPLPPPTLPAPDLQRRPAMAVLGLGWRITPGGSPVRGQPSRGQIEGQVGIRLELNRSKPGLWAQFTVGASGSVQADFNIRGEARTATLARFPIRLGASVALPLGPGWFEPAAEIAADFVAISSPALDQIPASRSYRVGPGLEAGVGYRLRIAGPIHLRPRATIGFAIKTYDVGVQDAPDTIFSTPRSYASFGIDTGVVFR
jgi:hypothetical protein